MKPEPNSKRHPIQHHGTLGAGGEYGTLYASLPMELARDSELSHTARSVALYVWSHSEGYQTSAEEVAAALGTTRKTVSTALVNLQQQGWLVRQQYARAGKRSGWERWHIQLSNTRFTPEEIECLSRTVVVEDSEEPADSVVLVPAEADEHTCVETTRVETTHVSKLPTYMGRNYPPTWVETTHQSSASLVVDSLEVNPPTVEVVNREPFGEVPVRLSDEPHNESGCEPSSVERPIKRPVPKPDPFEVTATIEPTTDRHIEPRISSVPEAEPQPPMVVVLASTVFKPRPGDSDYQPGAVYVDSDTGEILGEERETLRLRTSTDKPDPFSTDPAYVSR